MKKQQEKNGFIPFRREFIQKSAVALAALPLVGGALQLLASQAQAQGAKPAEKKAEGGAKLDMVKPTEPMAQSLGYYEDATKVDTKKWEKRATEEGKKQFCYNCMFYKPAAGVDPKTTEAAPCTIFQNRGVKAKGWCNSWVQNQAVKG